MDYHVTEERGEGEVGQNSPALSTGAEFHFALHHGVFGDCTLLRNCYNIRDSKYVSLGSFSE